MTSESFANTGSSRQAARQYLHFCWLNINEVAFIPGYCYLNIKEKNNRQIVFDTYQLQIFIHIHSLLITTLRYLDVYMLYMSNVGNVLYIVIGYFWQDVRKPFKDVDLFIYFQYPLSIVSIKQYSVTLPRFIWIFVNPVAQYGLEMFVIIWNSFTI